MEIETNNKLSFLDCHFETSVYRKYTFSGLGMSYFSFCPYLLKINSVTTLFYRAYSNCSTYLDLPNKFQFIISYFCKNEFPKNSIENCINILLEKFNSAKLILPSYDDPKKTFYISFTFFDHQSIKMNSKLQFCYFTVGFVIIY